IASLSRRVCGRETMHELVKNKGKAKDKYYGKLILDMGNEMRSSMEERADAMENFESVDAAIDVERARQANAGNNASGSGEAREDKKVKFATATLRGPTLTWWNSKVAISGLDVANQMGWTEMKKLMTTEFCPCEELQRMENKLWNLKVKEYNMVAYT
nr:putative reverse transcriptase domain-containing protein [Tanacetum cinerariifolium]